MGVVVDQLSGLVVRASALRLGGRGFDPRPSHTKDYKNGTHTSLLGAQHQGLDWGALRLCGVSAYYRPCATWWRRGFDSRAWRPLPHVSPISLPPFLSVYCPIQ